MNSIPSQGLLFLSAPEPDEILRRVDAHATEINVLTFWSLEPAYPGGRLRYHLGQLGMTRLMNQLANKGCVVQALICDAASRSVIGDRITGMPSDIEVSRAFIERLSDRSVKVQRLSELVDHLLANSPEARGLADRVVRGALRFRNVIQQRHPPNEVVQRLSRFRAYSELNPDSLDEPTQAYLKYLEEQFPAIPRLELLASLFASYRRPSWFDAFWLGDLAAWIATQAGAQGKNALILEANRSAYSWLTHKCFLGIGCQMEPKQPVVKWPTVCFVEPLLSMSGKQPMTLDTPQDTIFAHHSENGLRDRLRTASKEALESYRRWFLPELSASPDTEALRDKLFENVRELTGRFDPDFLVRKRSRNNSQPTLVPSLRIGLCLSGGGFRATFYHLGAIRLLQQLALLKQVTGVYSVSGGSILAGHLAKNWKTYAQCDQSAKSFLEASKPLFRMAQEDLRGRIVRRWLAFLGLLGTGWIPRFIEAYYQKVGGLSGELKDLPSQPTFAFLATSMRTGRAVSFLQGGFHDGTHFHNCPQWPIARAVAASSAFPPVFPAIPISDRDLVSTNHHGRGVEYLTDGGVYDNLGLSRLMQDAGTRSDERWCELILVSDASAPFGSSLSDKFNLMLTRGLRTTDILMKRVAELEAAANAADVGTEEISRPYVIRAAIDNVVLEKNPLTPKADQGSFILQDAKVQDLLARIRTDLDVFSTLEIAALMRHGYEVMLDSLIKAGLVPQDFVPADPCGGVFPSMKGLGKVARVESCLGEMPEIKDVRDALEQGRKRKLRIFNPSDCFSWFLLVEVIVLPLLIWYFIIRQCI